MENHGSTNIPFLRTEDNQLRLNEKNNVFLIDWLTVVFHAETVSSIQLKLGLLGFDIPWDTKVSFKNGYPMQTSWSNINIRWGADDPAFYKNDEKGTAEQKVRHDMGICLDMSGQGCRTFEQFSNVSWIDLLTEIFRSEGKVHITRLDLAYDDHVGLLDIYEIEKDVRDRNYVSKSKKSMIIWSDDQDEDLQGLTVEVGSRKSDVLIRIYNKAAERGYDHSKHWVRVELQLRKDRAHEAARKIFQIDHVGKVAAGILRNYCTFRSPSGDTNKSRWPISPYWDRVILDMERISIWIAPGEPYNFSKSENHMVFQFGQWLQAYAAIHGSLGELLDRSRKAHPELSPKYHAAIAAARLDLENRKRMAKEIRDQYGFESPEWNYIYDQIDMAEIFVDDPGSAPGDHR